LPLSLRVFVAHVLATELLELLLLIHESFIKPQELIQGLIDLYNSLESDEQKMMIIYNLKYWAEGNAASFHIVCS
jgi:hypothetical protein